MTRRQVREGRTLGLEAGHTYDVVYRRPGGAVTRLVGVYAGEALAGDGEMCLVFRVDGSGFRRWLVAPELVIEVEEVSAGQVADGGQEEEMASKNGSKVERQRALGRRKLGVDAPKSEAKKSRPAGRGTGKAPAGRRATPVVSKDIDVVIAKRDADAKGRLTTDGFAVLAGSVLAPKLAQSGKKDSRKGLLEAGVLEQDGKAIRFAKDHAFSSPSAASALVLGRSSNGWDDWETSDGQTLGDAAGRKTS